MEDEEDEEDEEGGIRWKMRKMRNKRKMRKEEEGGGEGKTKGYTFSKRKSDGYSDNIV